MKTITKQEAELRGMVPMTNPYNLDVEMDLFVAASKSAPMDAAVVKLAKYKGNNGRFVAIYRPPFKPNRVHCNTPTEAAKIAVIRDNRKNGRKP